MLKPRPATLTLMEASGWWAIIGAAALAAHALLTNLIGEPPAYTLDAFALLFAVFMGGLAMVGFVRLLRRRLG